MTDASHILPIESHPCENGETTHIFELTTPNNELLLLQVSTWFGETENPPQLTLLSATKETNPK